MFKDDSINLTYKRLQLLETNDTRVQEGSTVHYEGSTVALKQGKCTIRLPVGDAI